MDYTKKEAHHSLKSRSISSLNSCRKWIVSLNCSPQNLITATSHALVRRPSSLSCFQDFYLIWEMLSRSGVVACSWILVECALVESVQCWTIQRTRHRIDELRNQGDNRPDA